MIWFDTLHFVKETENQIPFKRIYYAIKLCCYRNQLLLCFVAENKFAGYYLYESKI